MKVAILVKVLTEFVFSLTKLAFILSKLVVHRHTRMSGLEYCNWSRIPAQWQYAQGSTLRAVQGVKVQWSFIDGSR